jgi:Negative regulator of sigma F
MRMQDGGTVDPAGNCAATLIRRGASTDRAGTALAAGLASAAWGAFVFVFACPSDDPLYRRLVHSRLRNRHCTEPGGDA